MTARRQLGFDLGDGFVPAGRVAGELGAGDEMPPGPYTVGMTYWEGFGEGPPWTVRCGDGRAVAGHVGSREIAEAIALALNRCFP